MRSVCNHRFAWRFVCWTALVSIAALWGATAAPARGDEAKPASEVPKSAADAKDASLSKEKLATPTHHQTSLIQVDVSGQPKAALKCFCLTADDRILAGCESPQGEVRVFDRDGKYLASWKLPVKPEAIFARADGMIFVAGEGQLVKLNAKGGVELKHEAPHAAAMGKNRDAVRAEVIAQNKQMAQVYGDQAKMYDTALEGVEQQMAALKKQLDALKQPPQAEAGADDEAMAAARRQAARYTSQKTTLERQLKTQQQMKQQYEQAKSQWAEVVKQLPTSEPTEQQIDAQIRESMQSKLAASSICATDENVFLTTRAAVGYGFEVLKMDANFEHSTRIIADLSGCCGQMDVKCDEDGLFVAENSHHRVGHYNFDGKLIANWGTSTRNGLEGFGSCCNPMNVTFGGKGVVYTAEDTTGRIKRYSPDGKLLGLVGSAEVVPGCKNVTIAVTSDESRVYMLDVTHGHIVRMDPYGPGEKPRPVPYDETPETGGDGGVFMDSSQSSSVSGGSFLIEGLKALFGG